MVVIDSDLIIKYLRGKPQIAIDFMDNLFESNEKMNTTIFNYAEIIEGAYLTKNVSKNLRYAEKFLEKFEILPFQMTDAQLFAQIRAQLGKSGNIIGDFDVLIAAIAMNRNETLISRNVKHFSRIPMLKFLSWENEP